MASDSSFGRLVLVTGPETLLAERAITDAKLRALVEDESAQVTDVAASDLDAQALGEMTGASLFAARSVAVIRNLADVPADLVDLVAGVARDVPDDVALILQHGGGNKGKGLLDKLKKLKPETVTCDAIKPWKLPEFVTGEARRHKARIDNEAARALVAAVGNDTRALAAAVDQLLSDSDSKVIDADLVRRYFAGRAEVAVYSISDDVLAGRTGAALEKLRWALETGASPVQVTATLAGSLRTLGKYLAVRDARMREAEIAAAVGCPPFKVKDLAQQAKSWGEGRVARGLQAVAEADGQVKGAAASSAFVLEALVLQLSRRPG